MDSLVLSPNGNRTHKSTFRNIMAAANTKMTMTFYERFGPDHGNEKRAYECLTLGLVKGKTASSSGKNFTHVYKWVESDGSDLYASSGLAAYSGMPAMPVPAPCHGILDVDGKEIEYELPTVKGAKPLQFPVGNGFVMPGGAFDMSTTVDMSSLPDTQKIVAWNTKSSTLVARVVLKRVEVRGTPHVFSPTGEIYCYYPVKAEVWMRFP